MLTKRSVLTLLCVALMSAGAAASTPSTLPQYILVIEEPSVLRARNAAEPDITHLGGVVEQSWSSRRVIRIPESAVETLRANPAVRYLQPLSRTSVIASQSLVAVPNTSTPPWSSGDYNYDGAGNIKAIGTSTYTYDAVSRLTSAAMHYYASPATAETYQYDGFGNLHQLARAGGATTMIPVDAGSNRLLASSAATYDAAGNLNSYDGQQFSYDGLNMVVHKTLAGTTTAFEDYLYTADDERVGIRNGQTGTWHWKVRDVGGNVLRELECPASAPTGPWLWVEDYVYRDGLLLTGIREPAEGGQRHFHLDHLGTPRLITNSAAQLVSANDYAPYGVELTPLRQERTDRGYDRVDPMKFAGHERDFTAGIDIENTNYIDYMHARYYSPLWGRFLSTDKVGGSPADPQTWNRYAYARGNPVKYIDPHGHWFVLSSEGNRKDVRAALIQVLMRPSGRIAAETVGRAKGFWLVVGDKRINSDDAIKTFVRTKGNSDLYPGQTQGLEARDQTGKWRGNGPSATTSLDTHAWTTLPAMINPTITVGHEIYHAVSISQNVSPERLQQQDTDNTAEQFGKSVAAEQPDISEAEAEALFDEMIAPAVNVVPPDPAAPGPPPQEEPK